MNYMKGEENIMNSSKEESRSQIPDQIEKLDKGISVLSESIECLTNRLESTLRSQPPSVDNNRKEKGEPINELVPLASYMRQLKDRIVEINNNAQDILNRLEL